LRITWERRGFQDEPSVSSSCRDRAANSYQKMNKPRWSPAFQPEFRASSLPKAGACRAFDDVGRSLGGACDCGKRVARLESSRFRKGLPSAGDVFPGFLFSRRGPRCQSLACSWTNPEATACLTPGIWNRRSPARVLPPPPGARNTSWWRMAIHFHPLRPAETRSA
jgi:hypothetical protein